MIVATVPGAHRLARLNPFERGGWRFALGLAVLLGGGALGGAWLVQASSLPALWLFVVPFAGLLMLGVLIALRAPRATERATGDAAAHARWLALSIVAAALALLTLRDVLVWKPLAFYLFYAAAATALLLAGLRSPRTPRALALELAVGALLLGIVALGSQGLLPGRFGADTVFHRRAVEALVEAGSRHAIVAPYNSFAGYHLVIAVLVMSGISSGWAIVVGTWLLAGAALVAATLIAHRAFGTGAGALVPGLLAGAAGFLPALTAASPSKGATFALLLAVYAATRPGVRGALLLAVSCAVAFYYHPLLGAASALVAGAGAMLVGIRAEGFLARLGVAFGFQAEAAPSRRLSTRALWLLGLFMTGAVAAVATAVASVPSLQKVVAGPASALDQTAAVGAVRAAATPDLVVQTLVLNLATFALLVPAGYALARASFAPRSPGQLALAAAFSTMLLFVGGVVLTGSFLLGVERLIMPALALATILAAGAVPVAFAAIQRSQAARALGVLVIAVIVLVATSSYRIDGNDIFSPAVPKQADYVSAAMASAIESLRPHLREEDTVVFDQTTGYVAANFPSHSDVTLYFAPVDRFHLFVLEAPAPPPGAMYLFSNEGTARAHDERWGPIAMTSDRIFDNGAFVGGFIPPSGTMPG